MFKGLKTILALVTGATLGVLFSPKKGKDIRDEIKGEVDDGGSGFQTFKDAATAFGKDLSEVVKEGYDEVQKNKQVQDTVKKAKKATKKVAKKVKKEVKKTVKNIKKKQ